MNLDGRTIRMQKSAGEHVENTKGVMDKIEFEEPLSGGALAGKALEDFLRGVRDNCRSFAKLKGDALTMVRRVEASE